MKKIDLHSWFLGGSVNQISTICLVTYFPVSCHQVDRSVTGLVAQQQCVGPLHTPLADVAVVALSHFDTVSYLVLYTDYR